MKYHGVAGRTNMKKMNRVCQDGEPAEEPVFKKKGRALFCPYFVGGGGAYLMFVRAFL